MHSNAPSLPFKWYFVSFLSALGMALVLMMLFEIRIADTPPERLNPRHSKVQATTPPLEQPRTQLPKQEPEAKKLQVANDKKKSLWDMLVTPPLVEGASSIVVVAVGLAVGSFILSKRRKHP